MIIKEGSIQDIYSSIDDARRNTNILDMAIHQTGMHIPERWYRALEGVRDAIHEIDMKTQKFWEKHEHCSVALEEMEEEDKRRDEEAYL